MSDGTNRYRKEELQDDKGNVIYPHTDSSVTWIPELGENVSVGSFIKTRATDEDIEAALID